MHEFHIRMNIDLFKRIKILAEKYHISINEIMIELLENGYLKMLERNSNESTNFYR